MFENRDKIIIVMEYASGGELYDYVSSHGSLTETEARRIFRQITSAAYYCHKNKVIPHARPRNHKPHSPVFREEHEIGN